MYFASRLQAGRMLAAKLAPKYRYEDCAVICLDDGGVMVGAQIAQELHSVLMLLLTEDINLPMEPEAIGGIAFEGSFSYNSAFNPEELAELKSEFFNYIEAEKLAKLHKMTRLIGDGGIIKPELLRGRNLILVSEGLDKAFMLDIALQYLKPVPYKKFIVATPLASVKAVDRMHIQADELYCLSVVEEYISTEHYYDKQDIPSHEKVIEVIEKVILNWK